MSVPRPTRLSAATVPPCASTTARTSASPRPLPATGAGARAPVELLPDVRQVVGGDARPGVGHLDDDRPVGLPRPHLDPVAGRGVLDRVVHEVQQRQREQLPVAAHRRQRPGRPWQVQPQRPLRRGRLLAGDLHRLLQQRRHVDRPAVDPGCSPRRRSCADRRSAGSAATPAPRCWRCRPPDRPPRRPPTRSPAPRASPSTGSSARGPDARAAAGDPAWRRSPARPAADASGRPGARPRARRRSPAG